MNFAIRLLVLLVLPLTLSSCLISPGKFTAAMTVQKDGGFTFSYTGDIHLLGLTNLIEMASSLDKGEFTPSPCYTDGAVEGDAALLDTALQDEWDNPYGERECTEEELTAQREAWEAEQEKEKRDMQMGVAVITAFLGGLDPSDPAALDELARRVAKQKGWQSIVHKGDGKFEVDYRISGRLEHDYAFPVIEHTQGLSPFLVATVRANDAVRIEAPGFASATGGDSGMNSLFGIFGAIAQGAASADSDNEAEKLLANLPAIEGSFTITTNGEILTNNTDDGPVSENGMRVLRWTINQRTKQPPQALIGFATTR